MSFITVLVLSAAGSGVAIAEEESREQEEIHVKIDHSESTKNGATTIERAINVDDRSIIRVKIENTCKAAFSYEMPRVSQMREAELEVVRASEPEKERGTVPEVNVNNVLRMAVGQYAEQSGNDVVLCRQSTVQMERSHIEGFDYRLSIGSERQEIEGIEYFLYDSTVVAQAETIVDRAKSAEDPLDEVDVSALVDGIDRHIVRLDPMTVTIVTPVPGEGWKPEFSGGMAVSGLVDRNYREDSSGNIQRNRDSEDMAATAAVGFIHAVNDDRQEDGSVRGWGGRWVPSLGIGFMSEDPGIFMGLSYRMGDAAYISFGGAIGKRDTLRSSDRLGEPPTASDSLTELSRSTDVTWFLSFSYGIFGDRAEETVRNTLLGEGGASQ